MRIRISRSGSMSSSIARTSTATAVWTRRCAHWGGVLFMRDDPRLRAGGEDCISYHRGPRVARQRARSRTNGMGESVSPLSQLVRPCPSLFGVSRQRARTWARASGAWCRRSRRTVRRMLPTRDGIGHGPKARFLYSGQVTPLFDRTLERAGSTEGFVACCASSFAATCGPGHANVASDVADRRSHRASLKSDDTWRRT